MVAGVHNPRELGGQAEGQRDLERLAQGWCVGNNGSGSDGNRRQQASRWCQGSSSHTVKKHLLTRKTGSLTRKHAFLRVSAQTLPWAASFPKTHVREKVALQLSNLHRKGVTVFNPKRPPGFWLKPRPTLVTRD